jgi:hypothetical protein
MIPSDSLQGEGHEPMLGWLNNAWPLLGTYLSNLIKIRKSDQGEDTPRYSHNLRDRFSVLGVLLCSLETLP